MLAKFVFGSLCFWFGWTACATYLAIDARARWKEIERIRKDIEEMRVRNQ